MAEVERKTGDCRRRWASVVVQMSGDQISEVRIGSTNVAPCAIRAEAAEDMLVVETQARISSPAQQRRFVTPAIQLRICVATPNINRTWQR